MTMRLDGKKLTLGDQGARASEDSGGNGGKARRPSLERLLNFGNCLRRTRPMVVCC